MPTGGVENATDEIYPQADVRMIFCDHVNFYVILFEKEVFILKSKQKLCIKKRKGQPVIIYDSQIVGLL